MIDQLPKSHFTKLFVPLLMTAVLAGCNSSSDKKEPTKPTTPGTKHTVETVFPLSTDVFGVEIRATKSTSVDAVQHAAQVMAQYLDNDEDGNPDNPAIVSEMVDHEAMLLMTKNEDELDSVMALLDGKIDFERTAGLFESEVHPDGDEKGEFDATLEEVLHLISHLGYANAYPDTFGEEPGTSIADAMDTARGGRFIDIPEQYPANAWYTYNDETCDYACMVNEYTYWGLTSLLGAQEFQGRLAEIEDEWKLNTKEKIKTGDKAIYDILTNAMFMLPTVLPTGDYSVKEFDIDGAENQGSGNTGDGDKILADALAGNAGYKVAFGDGKNIMMMNADGSGFRQLAHAGPVSGYVSWGNEGRYVYFASAMGPAESAWEAFRVELASGEVTQLSHFGHDVRSLAVSPDGQYLAISIMNGNSNIGNNNDDLTQFHTDLYIVEMNDAQAIWSQGERLTKSDMRPLVTSPASDQFWYEELNWNPEITSEDGEPTLAYTKTWRYDEDDVSYTHVYTIKANGEENKLLIENKDMPIYDSTGERISFLDMSYITLHDGKRHHQVVTGIKDEVSGGAISPDGNFMIFEVGDENRKAGISRISESGSLGVMIKDFNVYEPRWSPVTVD